MNKARGQCGFAECVCSLFYKIPKCTRRRLNGGGGGGGGEEDRRNSPMNKRILTTSQRFDRSMRNPVSLFPHTRSISIARYYVLRFNYSTKLYGNCALFVGATPMIHGDFLSFFSIELYRAGSQFKYNTGEKNGEDLISFFSFFFFYSHFLFQFAFDWFFRKSQSFFILFFISATKIHGKHWFQLWTTQLSGNQNSGRFEFAAFKYLKRFQKFSNILRNNRKKNIFQKYFNLFSPPPSPFNSIFYDNKK